MKRGTLVKHRNASDPVEVSSSDYNMYLLQTMFCVHCLNPHSALTFTSSGSKDFFH